MTNSILKKLFIDVGVGHLNTEAWGREKEFTIIGLEPSTNRYNKLKDSYPGHLLNVAASDENGEIVCWEDPKYGVVLVKRPGIHDKFKETIKKSITLDSLSWEGFVKIHIWADIEGSELRMLKGATEMLSSGKVKWINLEIRKNSPAKGWASSQEVYIFLHNYGFKPDILQKRLRKKTHRNIIFRLKANR